MYVKVENNQIVQYPYSIEQFRADNSNISFPSEISNEILANHSVYPVSNDPIPAYDPTTQRVVKSNTPILRDGEWIITKSVEQLTADQITSYTITASNRARIAITELLQETDWCAGSDVTMSAEMTAYRQALRDIPQQNNFPHSISWPEKPA